MDLAVLKRKKKLEEKILSLINFCMYFIEAAGGEWMSSTLSVVALSRISSQ